jgi:hypothetical protein
VALLKFFADRDDSLEVLRFIFAETDARVFEPSSRYDQELREFRNLEEILEAFDIGRDLHGSSFNHLLSLWAPSVMPKPQIERVPLTIPGYRFWYHLRGTGLFHLNLGGICERVLTASKITAFSEKGAFEKSLVKPGPDEVDWKQHGQLSRKLNYHTQRRLKAASVRGGAVHKGAWALAQSGFQLKESLQTPWAYEPKAKD